MDTYDYTIIIYAGAFLFLSTVASIVYQRWLFKCTDCDKKLPRNKGVDLWNDGKWKCWNCIDIKQEILTNLSKQHSLISNEENYASLINKGGGIYKGQLHNGFYHGTGTYHMPDGTVYEGNWQNGKKHGYGILRSETGCWEGNWKRGKLHGLGKFISENGQYFGEWKEGIIHGHGLYITPNGEQYEGQWKSAKMHGSGVYTTDTGQAFEGIWENGKYVNSEKLFKVQVN